MLFNSYAFLLIFLPVTLAGYHWAVRTAGPALAGAWLTAASLVFYGWWNVAYLPLMLMSILFNFAIGRQVVGARGALWLRLGIAGDLLLLGGYKYAAFCMATLGTVLGRELPVPTIELPIGISFYTFTQIAYLVDLRRGVTRAAGLPNYALFVTYFPHLIAGPIIHFRDLSGQFLRLAPLTARQFAPGLTLFAIGLAKKVLIADSLAPDVDTLFGAVHHGSAPTQTEAWRAALGYTLQLYFDFSGYADMALGLGRMIGVRLPVNFDSPYRATSIVDFWRRWHITLSTFLRDYLYIPLGGGRTGRWRRLANLLIVMLLGGLWHGAGWTYVAWGGYHGVLLVGCHLWRQVRGQRGSAVAEAPLASRVAGMLATFALVVVGWTLFRAENFQVAWRMLRAMGGQGADVAAVPGDAMATWIAIGVLLAVVWLAPNSNRLVRDAATGGIAWRPSRVAAVATGVALFACLALLQRPSPFLYFQF